MGAKDILNGSGDLESARAERNNRLNPPEYAPGQDDDFFDDELFGESSVDNSTTETSLSLGGDFSGGLGGTFNTQQMQPPQIQQQGQMTSTEDKIFDAVAKGGKGALSFIKDLVASFKLVTPKFWSIWGSTTFIVSGVVSVAGLIVSLCGFSSLGINLVVGGLLSAGTGALVLMFNVDEAKNCSSKYKDDNVIMGESVNSSEGTFDNNNFGDDDGFTDEEGFADDEDFADDDMYDDFSADGGFEDDGDFVEDESFGDDDFFDEAGEQSSQQGVSPEEAFETLTIPDKGMYTRQYLYDMFTKVLDCIKPDYAKVNSINEDSNVFIQWEIYLRDACEATGLKEEMLPNLDKLEENLFTIKLTFNRPVGLKPDLVANELANIYAHIGGDFNSNVYAKSDVIGKSCIITIFTGETALISLKDMYENCKDFIMDNKNYIPVVLGINPLGKVIKFDFKNLESILITGMPRSGKSWFVQAVLTQMCAFVPPSELNIYICDPKDGISDFKAFKLPHVKKFVSGDANIVNTLRQVVRDLAPKRKRIIGDAGFVNIWDYKKMHPDVHMPVIYILIDEVVTLAERMEKEVKQEFQGLLVELISQLPALGIRAFLIPHVVKNDIIAKTATDLIPCRISVMGDAGHIESSTGTKPKDFPYKLTNKGDMAVKMPAVAPETMFIHAPALSDSNPKNNAIFDYLTKVWGKLEPEELANSVGAGAGIEEANRKAISELDLVNDGGIDIEFSNTANTDNSSLKTGNNTKGKQKSGEKVSDDSEVLSGQRAVKESKTGTARNSQVKMGVSNNSVMGSRVSRTRLNSYDPLAEETFNPADIMDANNLFEDEMSIEDLDRSENESSDTDTDNFGDFDDISNSSGFGEDTGFDDFGDSDETGFEDLNIDSDDFDSEVEDEDEDFFDF